MNLMLELSIDIPADVVTLGFLQSSLEKIKMFPFHFLEHFGCFVYVDTKSQ